MWTGLLGLFFGQFLGSGILTVLVKIGLTEFSPFLLSSIRFVIAVVSVFILFKKRNHLSFLDKDLPSLFMQSFFFAGNIAFFAIGLQFTTAIMSQIMYLVVPIIVMIAAHFVLDEKITMTKIMSFVIVFVGLFFLFSQSFQTGQHLTFGTPLGNMLIFGACIMWSLYIITSRKIAHKYSTIKVTFSNCLFTAILISCLLPFPFFPNAPHISGVTTWGIITVIMLGLGTVIQYIAMQYGIKHTSATTTSFFQYLAPIFAAVVAVPTLHEKITVSLVVGTAIILAGVFYGTTYPLLKKQKSAVQ